MRPLPCLVILAMTATAAADKKTEAMKPGFVKEAAACQIEARGRSLVIDGGKALLATVDDAEKADLERDLAALTAGQEKFAAYCTEVELLVAFLTENAAASYRSVEKELDARDNRVRALRKETKKLVLELQPITRRLIPRIKRQRTERTEAARAPSKFPSGRSVVLPDLSGTWSLAGTATTDTATYADKAASATISTRAFENATCDQQRKALAAKAAVISDLEVPDAAKQAGVVWSVRFTQEDKVPHLVHVACIARTDRGIVATADVQPAANRALAEEVSKLMFAMLVTR